MSAKAASQVVVDASIVIKWLLTEPDSAAALKRRQTWQSKVVVPVAPDFLLIELHNVLWKKVQRGDLAPEAPLLSYAPTFKLDLNWFPFEPLLPLAWMLAIRCHVSIYDALYAALAQQLNAPFCTANVSLAKRLERAVSISRLA